MHPGVLPSLLHEKVRAGLRRTTDPRAKSLVRRAAVDHEIEVQPGGTYGAHLLIDGQM